MTIMNLADSKSNLHDQKLNKCLYHSNICSIGWQKHGHFPWKVENQSQSSQLVSCACYCDWEPCLNICLSVRNLYTHWYLYTQYILHTSVKTLFLICARVPKFAITGAHLNSMNVYIRTWQVDIKTFFMH